MKKEKKILKHLSFSVGCFLLVNIFTYLFSYLELGFENFTTNLIINNLTTFFAVSVVILVKEVKFFSTEDTDAMELVIIFGFVSATLLFVSEASYSLSGLQKFFLACSIAMPFVFSLIHIKFGMINAVTISTTIIILKFFYMLEITLENYSYYLIIFLISIVSGYLVKIFFSFLTKILKKVKQKRN